MEKNTDSEERIEKKLNGINSFINHIFNTKELVTYFKDENQKSKKKYKKFETLNTILESADTIVIIGATSTSITLSITGIGLIVLRISVLSLSNKVLLKKIINQNNKYKKHYEKDQQTVTIFDKFYRKSLQDNVIDKIEFESLCNVCAQYLDETEKNLSYKCEYKNKIQFFW